MLWILGSHGWGRAVVLVGSILLGAVLAVAVGAATIPLSVVGRGPATVEAGDVVVAHVTFFGPDARPLVSTDPAWYEEMRTVAAGLPLFESSEGNPPVRLASHYSRPVLLGPNATVAYGTSLIGTQVGDRIGFAVVGEYEGFSSVVEVQRLRGPFNLTMTVPNERLEKFVIGRSGDVVNLDRFLEARVIAENSTQSTIRLLVADGQQFPVNRTGFMATTIMGEFGEAFHLRLSAVAGHQFALRGGCQYLSFALPAGTYRVDAVDESLIHLEYSPTVWPQLIRKPLTQVVAIVDIQKGALQAELDARGVAEP